MHGRHGKKKSKRIKLGKKYKVIRKVKEHHKKLKRDQKRHPEKYAKKKSDPGVPNTCPFKTQLIQEAQEGKSQELERREKLLKEIKMRRKEEKETTFSKNRNMGEFMTDDEKKKKALKTNSDKDQGKLTEMSTKTCYREFKKVVEESDIVLEVLDARDPMGCRCIPMEDLVNRNPDKRLVLVLNKADLVPQTNLKAWLYYLRKFYPVVLFKASTQIKRKKIFRRNRRFTYKSSEVTTSRCVGEDHLLKLLKNYSRGKNSQTPVVVGVVGIPNVGKSSLISSLKSTISCSVDATAGFIKPLQEVSMDSKIRLLDCAGVILPGGNVGESSSSLRDAFKLEGLEDPISPVEEIMKRAGKEQLMVRYGMSAFENTAEFLALYAKRTGKLVNGVRPKLEDAARSILLDWNSGDLNYYTCPPQDVSNEENLLEIESKLSQEFRLSDHESSEKELFDLLPDVKPSITMSILGLSPIKTEKELIDMEEVPEEFEITDGKILTKS